MNHFKYNLHSTATALLIGLTLHGCQNRLQVTGEEKNKATPETSMPSSKDTIGTTPSRKRPAEVTFSLNIGPK